jgi:membrane protein DedA with SNARE-associated domain
VFDQWPFALTYGVFVAGAFIRANATYWLGRTARTGGEHTRAAARLNNNPLVRRAETVVARYGAVAVALSFLTVGVQSAVNLAAGVLRMPLRRYEAGVAVGALAWAGIYTTIGFAVLQVWFGSTPWWGWGVVLGGVLLVVLLTRLARRRLAGVTPAPEFAPELAPELAPE